MSGRISYLNTDLDLRSADDLTTLAAELEARGVCPLHVSHGDDGLWWATFETEGEYGEPETTIAAMLDRIESLDAPHLSAWHRCTQREFNIGYDCGGEPWSFNQGLSNELLRRMAAIGASLRFTLYPDRAEGDIAGVTSE